MSNKFNWHIMASVNLEPDILYSIGNTMQYIIVSNDGQATLFYPPNSTPLISPCFTFDECPGGVCPAVLPEDQDYEGTDHDRLASELTNDEVEEQDYASGIAYYDDCSQ